jgi:lysophospholipase L1-like esterase
MHNIKFLYLVVLATMFWQCELSVDEFQPNAGELDLSSYVALGDSYSAGYTDGALGYESQMQSLPLILSQQFALAGGGEFKQPLMPKGTSVGTTVIDQAGNLNGYLKLNVIGNTLAPLPTVGDKAVFANLIGNEGPFNNMAVPGAKSFHLLAGEFGNPALGQGNYNPYYTRFASQPGISTVITDAMRVEPTFFSLWIGGNDVLSYALTGGTSDEITPEMFFYAYLKSIVSTLVSGNTQGVIANIPAIDALPYFSYLTSGEYIPFSVKDGSVEAGYRPLTAKEKILLPAAGSLATGMGRSYENPIPENLFLSESQLSAINDAILAYNVAIKEIAEDNNLAFVDMYGLMEELKTGLAVDGNTYTNTFVSGGIFSLDGIHATYRGYAIIANEFIRAINAQYNASIPTVNVNDYGTVVFP